MALGIIHCSGLGNLELATYEYIHMVENEHYSAVSGLIRLVIIISRMLY